MNALKKLFGDPFIDPEMTIPRKSIEEVIFDDEAQRYQDAWTDKFESDRWDLLELQKTEGGDGK